LFEGDWIYREYHREDEPEGCPFDAPALSPAERCLVGKFERTTSSDINTQRAIVTRTENRTEIAADYFESAVRNSIYYTNVSYWSIDDNELVRTDVDGDETRSSLDAAFWEEVAATRTTPEDPGCVPPDVEGPSSGPSCEDTCEWAADGWCDDGGPGSDYYVCEYGTDCADCGPRDDAGEPPSGPGCEDTCEWAADGWCDDGGPGSDYYVCEYGTDCADCGPRE
jgi:hypothetical protein